MSAGGLRPNRQQRSDHALTAFLVGLSTYLFVLTPLVRNEGAGRIVLDLAFLLVLSPAVFVMSERRMARLAAVLFVVAVVGRLTGRLWSSEELRLFDLAFAILFLAIVVYSLLSQIAAPGPVNSHRIRGAIAVYLLIGVIWGLGYLALVVVVPGAFAGLDTHGAAHLAPHEQSQALNYFSFVTLTTLGFGDIVPVHPFARTLVVVEALVGTLYLAVLISRLVSLEVASRLGPGEPADPGGKRAS